MINKLFQMLSSYGLKNDNIKTVLLIGSYARNTQKPDSDIDIMMITTEPGSYITETSWVRNFGTVLSIYKEYYGLTTSLRVFFREYEIEFGISSPEWIKTPMDDGTKRVLSDGYGILYENGNCLEKIKTIIPPLSIPDDKGVIY